MGVHVIIAALYAPGSDCEGLCSQCCGPQLSLSNVSAQALFGALGLDPIAGEVRGSYLVGLCQATLLQAPLEQQEEAVMAPFVVDAAMAKGARVILTKKERGWLRERVLRLQEIARAAGDMGTVAWS